MSTFQQTLAHILEGVGSLNDQQVQFFKKLETALNEFHTNYGLETVQVTNNDWAVPNLTLVFKDGGKIKNRLSLYYKHNTLDIIFKHGSDEPVQRMYNSILQKEVEDLIEYCKNNDPFVLDEYISTKNQ